MPRYDFRCAECATTMEKRYDVNTIVKAAPKCPDCGKPMNRVYSAPQRVWKDGQRPS